MKYSAVLVSAFAAGAIARAIPDDMPYDGPQDYTTTPSYGSSPTGSYGSKPTGSYGSKPTGSYGSSGSSYGKSDPSYGATHTGSSYGSTPSKPASYGKSDPSYGDSSYGKPSPKDTYDDREKKEGKDFHTYFPKPSDYDSDKNSCVKDVEYPDYISSGNKCGIKWKPKSGDDYKDTYIQVYKCGHYDAPVATVCESCGDGSYDDWTPPDSMVPSDCKGSATYRFKFCSHSKPDQYTWGAEWSYWNPHYYVQNPTAVKVESQCPPPPPNCPAATPAAPSAPVYSAPAAAPAAPAAPATYSAPAAPAAPAAAPAAPAAAPATNETAPVVEASNISGSSVFRASISVIVGVAALVTFAL